MGVLQGKYHCLLCGCYFFATSPNTCANPNCNSDRRVLVYLEVPVDGSDYLISGSADGQVGDDLLEFKSASKGTFRIEAPEFYENHIHTVYMDDVERTWVDLEGMWKDFRRPIKSHLRQGMLYLHFTGLKRIVFIYECKWDQAYKEFVIRYQPDVVEPMLEMALAIKEAIEKRIPPPCPQLGCAQCRLYEEKSAENPKRISGVRVKGNTRSGGNSASGISSTREAPIRYTRGPAELDADIGRRINDALHPTDSLERPYSRSVVLTRDKRKIR